MSTIRWVDDDAGRETTATLVAPVGRPRATLVLGHGAGGTRLQESLVLLQPALAAEGIRSLVFNFPYAERGQRRPDRMPVLERAYRGALEHARTLVAPKEPLLAGGRSMGGRVATHLAAGGEAVAGLVLLGYPLHPARQPEKLRVEHLSRIACPTLFISGTKDALATRDLLEHHVSALGGRAKLHWIEGADHGLDLPKRAGRDRADVARECASVVARWLDGIVGKVRHRAKRG